MCIRRCTFNSLIRLNFLSHSGQTNGFQNCEYTMHIQIASLYKLAVKWLLSLIFCPQILRGEWLFSGASCHNKDSQIAFRQCNVIAVFFCSTCIYIFSREIEPMHLSVEGLRPWDWSCPVLQYLRERPTLTAVSPLSRVLSLTLWQPLGHICPTRIYIW